MGWFLHTPCPWLVLVHNYLPVFLPMPPPFCHVGNPRDGIGRFRRLIHKVFYPLHGSLVCAERVRNLLSIDVRKTSKAIGPFFGLCCLSVFILHHYGSIFRDIVRSSTLGKFYLLLFCHGFYVLPFHPCH